MKKILNKVIFPDIRDENKLQEWKLNAFYKINNFYMLPACLFLLIILSVAGIWRMVAMDLVLILVLGIASWLAKKKRLEVSVNLAILAGSANIFLYLLAIGKTDSLYFLTVWIMMAALFLGIRAMLFWTSTFICVLGVIAHASDAFSVFPSMQAYLTTKNGAVSCGNYFSSFIFFYMMIAFLSIHFQKFFLELLKKIGQTLEEKLILESELLQAQKLESIGLLASGIAHDYSHGITSIKSSANILQNRYGAQNAELTKYTSNIFSMCDMISQSAGKLLAFVRKTRTDMANINGHELVESMATILKFMLHKNIEIKTELAAARCTIRGNFSQLQTVLMNMAVNSGDAMPEGGVLTFSTASAALGSDFQNLNRSAADHAPDNYLILKVSDTGIGMENAVIEKIFKSFFTTKEPGKGTGLGLSTADKIIKAHNGTIKVESTLGKGTTFTIYLPLAPKPAS